MSGRPMLMIAASLLVALGLAGCNPEAGTPSPASPRSSSTSPTAGASPTIGGSASPSPSGSAVTPSSPSPSSGESKSGESKTGESKTPSPTRTARRSPTPRPSTSRDPRNHFYVKDKTNYASPWFAGRHRIMIDFGCVDAPYYSPDARCDGGVGFHHGMDLALPCGTDIYAARAGRVAAPDSPGSLGDAYGSLGFRLRVETSEGGSRDIVIGHAAKVFIAPGDLVKKGQRIARSGDRGAPDGCHLHFEVRNGGGGLATAREPRPLLDLHK